MFIKNIDVVFQEVPGEISLALSVAGCPLRCPGCHSPELWVEKGGSELTGAILSGLIDRYKGMITCVLFFGGEWREKELCELLDLVVSRGLKSCLYTGEDAVPEGIERRLTFLKTGRWAPSLGGLDQKSTNQIFKEVETGKLLNHLFWR